MFKFNWSIENFCLLPQNTGEYIDCPVFEIKTMDNLKAFIRLFPKGKGSNTCISLLLLPADVSRNFESGTNIKISIADNSHSESKETFANLRGEFELVWFVRNAFKAVDFNSGLFMGENNLGIECIVHKPNCAETTVTSCLKTVVQMEVHKHDLSLHTFFPTAWLKEEFENSKLLSIEQQSDSFQFSVEKKLLKNALRVRRICRVESAVSVFLKVSLLGAAVYTELMCERHLFEADSETEFWEVPFDIEENAMEMFTTLRCEVIIPKGSILNSFENCVLPSPVTTINSGESKRNYKRSPLTLKSKTICNSLLRSMYRTKTYSDVILRVGTEQFPVHKCVLASISDFFAAMFNHMMKEGENDVAIITDIEKDILAKMLQFVYTGEVENLSSEDLVKLYAAADAYRILELKKLCSFHLSVTLSSDNAINMLELADTHRDPALEKAALNFIEGNYKEIFSSEKWADFFENHREIADDIMLNVLEESQSRR